MENKEIWKNVPGYINVEVSNLGNVIRVVNDRYEKKDSFIIDKDGYYRVNVQKENKTWSQQSVHRLVALAFIPNPENKPCVNHKDGNRINNNLDNLEWVTHKENVYHSYLYGNRKVCKYVPKNSILTDYQISQIDNLRQYYSLKEISKLFNIEYQSIKNIVIKKRRREKLDNQQPSIYKDVYNINEGSTTISKESTSKQKEMPCLFEISNNEDIV